MREAELLPMPLRFRGMPAARFWEFENATVWLGGIEAGPQDLARVVVAGYATVYGDDWYLVPLQLPVGTLTQVTRLQVLDDFGAVTDVPAAAAVDSRDAGAARAYRFFELTGDPFPARGRPPLLFLPPTVATTDAARPLEDVAFVRDEVANVAWAVERRVESAAGNPVDLGARLPGLLPHGAQGRRRARATAEEPWTFRLGTSPPDHWVPLLPVRIAEESADIPDGAIMFQRGRRSAPGAPGSTTGARGEILPPRRRLLLHEEEIPRSGIRVVRRWQSARDPAGRLHTWVGRRKGPGRGEGSSGVTFDILDRDAEADLDRDGAT